MEKLTKMKIVAFEHPDFSKMVGEYDILVNQEKSNGNHMGSFKMVLYFDGTGIVSKEKVADQIKKIRDLVYKFNGDIHEPNYLHVHWGIQVLFEGRLKSWNVNYTMLHMDGYPLRAEVTVVLVKALSAKGKKNSGDLTHVRTVLDGDNLPLMCHRIYGDSSHYLMVAKYNGLTNFRDLKPGQKVSFPPLN